MIKYMFDFWTDSSITNLFELVQFKFVQSPNINVYIMVGIEVLCSNIKFCLKFGTNSNTLKQNKYFWTKFQLMKLKKLKLFEYVNKHSIKFFSMWRLGLYYTKCANQHPFLSKFGGRTYKLIKCYEKVLMAQSVYGYIHYCLNLLAAPWIAHMWYFLSISVHFDLLSLFKPFC